MGLLAISCIGLLVLQKLRLQTRLDDSSWWLINYSDVTIIRESTVRTDKHTHHLTSSVCVLLFFFTVFLSSREFADYL